MTTVHTDLCDLLGCEHPIVLAPMGGVGTPRLTAAVSAAGGFGILPGAGIGPEELRGKIREVRGLTERPFGVNLLLHPCIREPSDADSMGADDLAAVQRTLDRFRERLGLPAVHGRPSAPPPVVDAALEVVLEERPLVLSIGLGKPSPELVSRCHERAMKVIAMVTSAADAIEVAATGVDAIVAQGGEAGGHRSTWMKSDSPDRNLIGTIVLVPQIAGAVDIPVIAAGGIVDGRGLAAALLLGASGAYVGTRFIATVECGAPAFYKKAVLDADSDATTVTDAFTGLYARVLRNSFTEEYRAGRAPTLPGVLQQCACKDITQAATEQANADYFPLYAGQSAGRVGDVCTAADVLDRIVREASELLSTAPCFLR